MKIALLAPGLIPVPPAGWGAVENIIWNYKIYLEELGHSVDIYNSKFWYDVVDAINQTHYDFIHTHSELSTLILTKHLKQKFCITSHAGQLINYITTDYKGYYNYVFEDLLLAPGNIVLSERIKDTFMKAGYANFLRVQKNAVEVKKFMFKKHGNGKAICLGKIQQRKRQALLAEYIKDEVCIDFIGPYNKKEAPHFTQTTHAKYMGEWTRGQVYEQLTEYSCLVMLSESEVAAPLVVLEALAAGLSVVVSETASDNLDHYPFIHIISESKIADRDYVINTIHQAIKDNHIYREDIREYALKMFDYSVKIKEYIKTIEEFNA